MVVVAVPDHDDEDEVEYDDDDGSFCAPQEKQGCKRIEVDLLPELLLRIDWGYWGMTTAVTTAIQRPLIKSDNEEVNDSHYIVVRGSFVRWQ